MPKVPQAAQTTMAHGELVTSPISGKQFLPMFMKNGKASEVCFLLPLEKEDEQA